MGFYRGPNIVTDGLVLALDAANKKSYPGSGTTWYDLSGNLNSGSLVNGPTFDSGNGGSIVFDGGNDYVDLVSLTPYSSNDPHTYSAIIKTDTLSQYRWIINNGSNTEGTSLIFNGLTDKIGFFYSGGAAVRNSNTILSTNTIYFITTVYEVGKVTFYLNGIYDGESTTPSTWSAINTNPRIGSWYNGSYYFNGNIYNIQIYNRALTPEEVQQNYNATKARFGL